MSQQMTKTYLLIIGILIQVDHKVFACHGSPGIGAQISNPTFSATINPPIGWTYSTTPSQLMPDQPSSLRDAQSRITQDINDAVTKAHNLLGFNAVGKTVTVSGYRPQLITNDQDDVVYVTNANGAITGLRDAAGIVDPFEHQLRITITGVSDSVVDFQNRWQILADQISRNLIADAGVNFVTPLIVSV